MLIYACLVNLYSLVYIRDPACFARSSLVDVHSAYKIKTLCLSALVFRHPS